MNLIFIYFATLRLISMTQPRTLELFKALGVLPEIMDVGMTKLPIKTCVVGKGDSEVVAISNMHTFNEPTPAFPYVSDLCRKTKLTLIENSEYVV